MSIEYTANYICEKCGKKFEWNFFAKRRSHLESASLLVEELPNKTLVHSFIKNNDGTYNVAVNCPYCDYDNLFIWGEGNE